MYSVFIADDDPIILDGLRCIIDWSALGLEIVGTATDGKSASRFITDHVVDILLTDIKMPEMDGIELIRWIRDCGFDIKCIILSGFDDYQYMKQAIRLNIENYLIKSINEDELAETLKNIIEKLDAKQYPDQTILNPVLRENILNRWISGRISNRELDERLRFMNIDLSQSGHIICLLRVIQSHGEGSPQLPLNNITQIIAQYVYLDRSYANTLYFQDFDGDYVFVFSGDNGVPDRAQIRRSMLPLLSVLSSRHTLRYFVTTGSIADGYLTVPESYKTAKRLMDYGLMMPENQYVDLLDTAVGQDNDKKSPHVDFESFKNMLITTDHEGVKEFVNSLYLTNYNIRTHPPDFLKLLTLRLLFTLLDAARYLKLDSSLFAGTDDLFYEKFLMFRSRDELYKWVSSMISVFFQVNDGTDTQSSPLIQRVENYVKVNYNKDISLRSLSFEFNINAAYLGRVFKEETNEAFSSYLNRIRIEKSKKILCQTNSSVCEVAKTVGYTNVNYFTSIFKKYEGVYPRFYREQHYCAQC